MAETMGAEAALVRVQLVSGTHAIATALYTCLRPGDRLLAVAGRWAAELARPQCVISEYAARMAINGSDDGHHRRSFLPHGSSSKAIPEFTCIRQLPEARQWLSIAGLMTH